MVFDRFGHAVAISGNTAIVGAYGNDDAGENSGSAYVFDTATGQQLFKITANDAEANDSFGASVGISGTTAIVGAPGDDDAGSRSGSAYIFDVTTGQQLFKLTASDALAGNEFGGPVSISGTTAIIGVPLDDHGGTNSGSAYVFNLSTPCNAADLSDEYATLDLNDIVTFVSAFTTLDPAADLSGDALYDLTDVTLFITAFNAGCP